jgi:hypothetical protein
MAKLMEGVTVSRTGDNEVAIALGEVVLILPLHRARLVAESILSVADVAEIYKKAASTRSKRKTIRSDQPRRRPNRKT